MLQASDRKELQIKYILALHTEKPGLGGRDVHCREILRRLGYLRNRLPGLAVVAALDFVGAIKVSLAGTDSRRKAPQGEREYVCLFGKFHCNALVAVPAELGAEFFHALFRIRQFHCDKGDVIAEGRSGFGLMPERDVQIWPCYKAQFRQFQMNLASLHIHDLPFKFLHGILGRNPGTSGTTPAWGAGYSHLHAQRISEPHCISVGLLPAVGKIRPLERRRLRHVDATGVELVESGYAHGIHPLQVLLDTIQGHLTIHPVPPHIWPRRPRRVLELFDYSVIAIRRSRQHGQKHCQDHLHILQI